MCSHKFYLIIGVDFVYYSVVVVNTRSFHRSIVILKFYKNGNSNFSRHLHIWFTCKLYWVCLIYRVWATLSTIKRSIRRTWGLIEVRSLPSGGLLTSMKLFIF
uniref:Photosystem II protein N n=1 Tax=Cenchrus ciliaris TaxID=35872 RepID=A0A482EWM2_CENCI|nr:photosystem II protein N [Cenchrus ciliaris]QBM92317.1 photosystem II protein N [Cenchrus ciliaris]